MAQRWSMLRIVLPAIVGMLGLAGDRRTVAAAGTNEQKKETTKLAFVLLAKPRLPAGNELTRAFAPFASKECQLRVEPRVDSRKDGGEAMVFDLTPGGHGFIGLMPTPIPNREADDAAVLSVSSLGTGWKLPRHTAHLIVSLTDDGTVPATQRLARLTWLLAAVAQASGAVGVYWGDAGATHDPKFFLTMAKEKEMAPRLMLWTGVNTAKRPDGSVSLLSTGMTQLGLPNLLLNAPAKSSGKALETFFDLLTYVAKRGQALPEGDTVGRTADERLPVHYVPSPVDPKEKVWRVELR